MGGGRPGISGDRDPQRKTAGRGRTCSPLVSHSRCAAWRCESGIADVCLCAVPFVQVVRVLGIYDLPQTHAQRALDVCVTPIFVLYICGVSRKRWGVSCVCVCLQSARSCACLSPTRISRSPCVHRRRSSVASAYCSSARHVITAHVFTFVRQARAAFACGVRRAAPRDMRCSLFLRSARAERGPAPWRRQRPPRSSSATFRRSLARPMSSRSWRHTLCGHGASGCIAAAPIGSLAASSRACVHLHVCIRSLALTYMCAPARLRSPHTRLCSPTCVRRAAVFTYMCAPAALRSPIDMPPRPRPMRTRARTRSSHRQRSPPTPSRGPTSSGGTTPRRFSSRAFISIGSSGAHVEIWHFAVTSVHI